MLFGLQFATLMSGPGGRIREPFRKYFPLLLLLFTTCFACNAQNPETLTNETVIKMVASGVPIATVIKTIQLADSVAFRFLPGDLSQLTQYKVPDDVVKAMAERAKGRSMPASGDVKAMPVTQAQTNGPPLNPSRSSKVQAPVNHSCSTYFTVIATDRLNNIKQGLSADDLKWFQKTFAKKYPNVCYAEAATATSIVFYITVTPDVYHGTRVVTQTSTHSDPVNATVTDEAGNTAQVSGTVEHTSTSSTAVPYSVDYGIYTLSVERRKSDGAFEVVHRFQQKGLYNTLYGIPLGGKGHHPVHTVIEGAIKWVAGGGLTDPKQGAF